MAWAGRRRRGWLRSVVSCQGLAGPSELGLREAGGAAKRLADLAVGVAFDAAALKRMKTTALLVNTARGHIVDGDALAEALEVGDIEAAAMDVTEVEPLPSSSRLLKLPNCYVTPHIAAVSAVFMAETAVMQAENVIRVLTGTKPHGLANPEVIKTVAVMRRGDPGRWAGVPDFSTALQV